MNRTDHHITVCTSCRDTHRETRPGYELITQLRAALKDDGYTVAAAACMAGCDRPCTAAFHAPGKASYLFGDLDPKLDVDDLVQFARQYAFLRDGWCSSLDRPGKLRQSTLARIPALLSAQAQENLT